MSITVTTIKQVDSEFDDIYRITTENGLILDIPEIKPPSIGSNIEYYINDVTDRGNDYTVMNGIFFVENTNSVLVSFGGLLANIPVDETTKKTIIANPSVSLTYKLLLA
jgi:hypothetical protein